MKKKSILLMAALMMATASIVSCTSSTHEQGFVIEGRLTNVPDSTRIVVFENMGNHGLNIAQDTIIEGKFRLAGKTNEEGLRFARIYCYSPKDEFTCISWDNLCLIPGSKITIDGTTTDHSEWKIKSNVPAQKTMNLFREQTQEEYSLMNQLCIEHYPLQEAFFDEKRLEQPMEIQKQMQTELEGIRASQESVDNILCRKQLNLMAKLPIAEVWLHQMRHITWSKDPQVQKVAKQLCQQLDASHKMTEDGEYIMNHFFPSLQVKVGDMVPDIELKDTLGHTHRLKELQGRYVLLDFWRNGCQPCMMSIPEMGEIAEQMKDSVAVVSISPDDLATWKETTIKHGIKWHNWNDMKGVNGIFAHYQIKGYPTYFLVAPNGKLIAKQVGYSKGSLFKFVQEHTSSVGKM